MNKSSQYNQQTEPKQCKSQVEEIRIHQNLETGHYNIWKQIQENRGGSMLLERISLKKLYIYLKVGKSGSFMKQ